MSAVAEQEGCGEARHRIARCPPYHVVNALAILNACIWRGDQGDSVQLHLHGPPSLNTTSVRDMEIGCGLTTQCVCNSL